MAERSVDARDQDSETSRDDVPFIKSIKRVTLNANPSCVEFSLAFPKYFVVGTYELEESSKVVDEGEEAVPRVQQRHGSLSLFSFDEDIVLHQTLESLSGILDLHFKPSDPNVLAAAASNGTVSVYYFNVDIDPFLAVTRSIDVFSDELLSLSLSWCLYVDYDNIIAVSCSNGQLALVDIEDKIVRPQVLNKAHSLEAWTITWAIHERHSRVKETTEASLAMMYSGGDDSALCKHFIGLQVQEDASIETKTAEMDTKTHSAGVTAILPLQSDDEEQLVLTGSYDEYLRLLQFKKGRSTILAEQRLGGGVWRLKMIDSRRTEDLGLRFKVLASCMHAGVRILEIGQSHSEWYMRILAKFVEHESMNYASDARPLSADNRTQGHTFVSTSFYDRKLCAWNFIESTASS